MIKIKLNEQSIATITEIMRVNEDADPSFIVNRSLEMTATIANMPIKDQVDITEKLLRYSNEPTEH